MIASGRARAQRRGPAALLEAFGCVLSRLARPIAVRCSGRSRVRTSHCCGRAPSLSAEEWPSTSAGSTDHDGKLARMPARCAAAYAHRMSPTPTSQPRGRGLVAPARRPMVRPPRSSGLAGPWCGSETASRSAHIVGCVPEAADRLSASSAGCRRRGGRRSAVPMTKSLAAERCPLGRGCRGS